MTIRGLETNWVQPLGRWFDLLDGFGDMSASYELPWLPTSPQITLNAINFTDAKQRGTFQCPSATNSFYNPGYQILLGIRGKF